MSTSPLNAASRTKTVRRSDSELQVIYDAIYRIAEANRPMTLRGLFYQLVSAGVIPKKEAEYEKVGRYLLKLRRDGTVPYAWIADNTRWQRKPRTFGSLEEALKDTAYFYRRAIWDEQDCYVEVWCEKDTLAGVLMEVTAEWDVPLMVCRGFASESYVHSAAETIATHDVPAFLYLLTDYDPSGLAIAKHVDDRIRQFLPFHELHIERIAVNESQIVEWNLPTRPTKLTDSRSKGFVGESVELDAIPPPVLRGLVRDHIERHIDIDRLHATKRVEQLEKQSLIDLAWGDAA